MKREPVALTPEEAEKKTRYLYWWLLLAIFFEYARPGAFVPIPGQINSLIPMGLLLVQSFSPGLRPLKEIWADRLGKWPVIYLALIFISVIHAEVQFSAFNVFTATLGYFFIFVLIARIVTTPGRLFGLFLTLVIAHIFLLAMNPEVVLDPNERHYVVGGTFLGDGNDFSLSMCILIPLALELALRWKGVFRKTIAWLLFVIIILGVIGTSSRGATLGMAAVFAYLWWRSPRKLAGLIGVAVVACGVLIYAPPLYFERMSTLKNYQEEGSAQGRLTAWKAGVRMMADHPIGGVSVGHYAISFGTKYKPRDYVGPWLTAHSMYFLALGELGLPGIFTLLMLIFGGMRENARVTKAVLARAGPEPPREVSAAVRLLMLTSAAMVGFAVAGAFLSVAYYPHIFVLTAILISARSFALAQVGMRPEDLLSESTRGRGRSSRIRKPSPGVSSPAA